MKAGRMIVCSIVAGFAFIFLSAATSDSPSWFKHTVSRGETVSLLCIQYYGHYDPRMGTAFLENNPHVKNINLIYVGQRVRFPKPVTQAQVESVSTPEKKKEKQLFVKKVHATQGVVTWVEGAATLISRDGSAPQALAVNTIVYPEDVIETGGDGRVELIINRETVVRLRENTQVTVEAFRNTKENKGKSKVGFSVGSVWTKMKKFKDKVSRFELTLPTAIAGVHGTVYQTSCAKDSSAEVKVYSGEVAVSSSRSATGPVGSGEVAGPQEVPGPHEVSMETWTEIVRSMQRVTIGRDGKPTKPRSFSRDPKNEWEKWNEERDRMIAVMFGERSAK